MLNVIARLPGRSVRSPRPDSAAPTPRDDVSDCSTLDFPIHANAAEVEEDIIFHINGSTLEPIPVFTKDQPPLDGATTLENTLTCPLKFLCKTNPTMVVDNYCFILDGDSIPIEPILSDQTFWKQTSISTRCFYSETLRTFHQVTLLSWKGSAKSAYLFKKIRGGGLVRVDMEKVFKVTRFFFYWHSCKSFHRIVCSVCFTVLVLNAEGVAACGFNTRIFVQYFWRSEKKAEKERVLSEYLRYYGRRDTGIGSSSCFSCASSGDSGRASTSTSARNSVQLGKATAHQLSVHKKFSAAIPRPFRHLDSTPVLAKKRPSLDH